MIYGRPAALWLGLTQAAINLVALGYVAFVGVDLTAAQAAFFAGLNTLAAGAVALLANREVNGSLLGGPQADDPR